MIGWASASYDPVSLLGIVIAWKILDLVFSPVHLMFIHLLYPGHGYHEDVGLPYCGLARLGFGESTG